MDMDDIQEGAKQVEDEAKSNAHGDLDQLKSDLTKLRGDMGQVISSMVGLSRRRASTAREAAQSGIDQGIEQLHRRYRLMRRRTNRAADSLAETLSERPLTSVAVAFGVGMLLGKIISRK